MIVLKKNDHENLLLIFNKYSQNSLLGIPKKIYAKDIYTEKKTWFVKL